MRKLPPLNSLKAFEASGRHLNFRLAADELGVTQGAVAQQVRGLEELLKIKLFDRQPRGLSLTDEGRGYLPAIRRAFDMIGEATEQLSPQDAVVTISTTPSFATRWLVPKLGRLAQDHPELRVRLDASNALANFQTDGVDIAIRQGTLPFGPGLVAEKLFSGDLIAVCHPDLAAGSHPIEVPSDLAHHMLLEDTHGHWPLFLEALTKDSPEFETKSMAFSQTSMAIDAAIAGQGVALTARDFVIEDLAAHRLCQPFEYSMPMTDGYYLVAPRRPRKPALVAMVNGWLLAQL